MRAGRQVDGQHPTVFGFDDGGLVVERPVELLDGDEHEPVDRVFVGDRFANLKGSEHDSLTFRVPPTPTPGPDVPGLTDQGAE
jgi:hypothetical protein